MILGDSLTVAQAEAAHPGITDARVARWPEWGTPFGALNGQWEALKRALQPGDEIRPFRTSPESWRDLCGSAGIVLMRDGAIVAMIVTMRN